MRNMTVPHTDSIARRVSVMETVNLRLQGIRYASCVNAIERAIL